MKQKPGIPPATTPCRPATTVCWLRLLALAVIASGLIAPAQAHFRADSKIRIVHFEPVAEGLRLSMRLSSPLAFSEYIAAGTEANATIPYTLAAVENGQAVHYLDMDRIRAERDAFAHFIIDDYRLAIDGEPLAARVLDLQVYPAESQSGVSGSGETGAESASGPALQAEDRAYVGDTVIDVKVLYAAPNPDGEISFTSLADNALTDDLSITNLLIRYAGQEQIVAKVSGPLTQAVVIHSSRLAALRAFVLHGFDHILSGYDHILFILCLTIGAASLGGLVWRVTGFTIGHTLTLIAGFYGYVPQGDWFIPLVEIAIAASIIYVAVLAMRISTTPATLLVTTLIGLLHGFGFSFLLSDLLGADSPHLLTSLLSFNLGIEIGQLLIVSIVFVLLIGIERRYVRARRLVSQAIAIGSIAVAAWWVIERGQGLASVI